MSRPRVFVACLALLITGLAGCSKDSSKAPDGLPDGATLTNAGAAAMREVTAAHIVLEIDGTVSTLPLRRAEGDLARSGDAKGSVQLAQSGALIEYQFVLVGGSIYLKGVSGGWQQLPASAAAGIYDPSAILDPERGVAKLLATATDPKTEDIEKIDGVDMYRIQVNLSSSAVAALVPGVSDGVSGKIWLDTASKRLRRAILTVGNSAAGKTGTITINLTDLDKPVSVSAPS